jgi:hypothetical protein
LVDKYPYEPIPPLPSKDWFQQMHADGSAQVKDRMKKLQHFLTILATHPKLSRSQEVKDFLADFEEYHFDQNFKEDTKYDKLNEIASQAKGNISYSPVKLIINYRHVVDHRR